MNETTISRQTGILPLILQHLTEKVSETGRIIFVICILAVAGDMAFSIQYGRSMDAIAMGFVLAMYVCQQLLAFSGKQVLYLPQIVYFMTCVVLALPMIEGNDYYGNYFILFPASIAYFCHSVTQTDRKRFGHYFLITSMFFALMMINQFVMQQGTHNELTGYLWHYRMTASIALGGLLIRQLVHLHSAGHPAHAVRRNYYEALFQSYQDAFVIYRKDSNEVVDCNMRLLYMLELPDRDSLKGLTVSQVMMRYLSGESPNMDTIMNGLPDNWFGEADFVTVNKHVFHAQVKCVDFTKDDTEYCILTIRDVTEMKVAERELKNSKAQVEKAAKAKARFLSSMSHELRTPLNGIIGTSNLMLAEPHLPESAKKHINVLKYSSEHMLGIINDILDFSKIDAGKMELKKHSFNLKESLENLLISFENQFRAKDIDLVPVFDNKLDKAFVMSDKVKLGQVISNLLSNALKFTLSGKVELRVNILKSTSRKITLRFEVKDTGIGIAKDKQAEIFQGFTQVHAEDLKRDFGGTGLGLTISEKLVNMFGGELQVESELGKGSSFYFTISLPVAETMVREETVKATSQEGVDIRGIRVLIVEDNEINATILKNFLAKWEVNVKEATHGIQALELLKYHRFDLVMMDLEMPEMDGYTTIRRIRETDQELPVVAFTAALLENMESFIAENGFNDYILKPYRPSDLKAKIAKYAPHRKVDY